MSSASRRQPTSRISPGRSARLYKLLSMIAGSSRSRQVLMKRLKLDLRSFYRDIESLRALSIPIECHGDQYTLAMSLDEALNYLPFPDPEFSVREVLILSEGRGAVHQALREKVDRFLAKGGATAKSK
jgi:predicted DNA-binding transcriptional regulator YafY